MHLDRTKTIEKSIGQDLQVEFAPNVKSALADLAAAVHFSEHFDGGIRRELQDWAAGKTLTAHDVIVAMPAIAGETFKHILATGDGRAQEAWDEVRSQIAEKGFTVSPTPVRGK